MAAIPVGSSIVGTIRRSRTAFACTARSGLPRDVWIQLRLTDLVRRVSWIDADHARSGEWRHSAVGTVDSMHSVQVLRRIAAAIPATAIIDDLWVPCE